MKKNPIQIPPNCSIVTTFDQAEFHFSRGSVLGMPVTWFTSLYLLKSDEDKYDILLVPLLGRSLAYEGDKKSTKLLLEEYDFFVCKGDLKKKSKVGLLDKIFSWFQSKFDRERDKNGN